MSKHLLLCCILMGFVVAVKPLSILLVQPLMSPSHHIWTISLVKGLLSKGHHVHLVSIQESNIKDKLAQNLTEYTFDDMIYKLHEDENYDPTLWNEYSVYGIINYLYEWGYFTCEEIVKTKAAGELLRTIKNVKFDVIVQDVTLNECLFSLWEVAKGSPPVVGFILFGSAPWIKDYVGGSNYPSIRTYGHNEITMPRGLWQRVWNFFYFIIDDAIRHYDYLPALQKVAEQYIGHKVSPLLEIGKNMSFVLVNTHSSFEHGIPLPPNALEIGGLHAQTAEPIVDQEIRKYLDGATNGAVVISLGTNVEWKAFDEDKVKAVISVLSKLKQRVLWKMKEKISLPTPDNVKIVKWLPQNDVLTHKNVKVLWAHGGLLSTQEAIWHGVPLIIMPFFMDQQTNMRLVVSKGAGVHVDFKTLSEQSVSDAFNKILYDESYVKNMKQLSYEFRDRPMPPLDLAIWSIEYAARHRPGSLASPIRSQSWAQENGIDVYAFFFFIFIVILSVIFLISKMLFNFFYQHKHSASKRSKIKEN